MLCLHPGMQAYTKDSSRASFETAEIRAHWNILWIWLIWDMPFEQDYGLTGLQMQVLKDTDPELRHWLWLADPPFCVCVCVSLCFLSTLSMNELVLTYITLQHTHPHTRSMCVCVCLFLLCCITSHWTKTLTSIETVLILLCWCHHQPLNKGGGVSCPSLMMSLLNSD